MWAADRTDICVKMYSEKKINNFRFLKNPEYFYLVTSHRWHLGRQEQIQLDPGSSSSVESVLCWYHLSADSLASASPLTRRLSPELSSYRTFKAACWWIPVRFTCVLERTLCLELLFIQDPGAYWTVVTYKAMPWMHSNQRGVRLRGVFVLVHQSGLSGEIAVWTHQAAPSRALVFSPPQRSADWLVYGNCTAYPLSLTTI